jgi:hypothetical protein
MTKLLPYLLVEADELERRIRLVRSQETRDLSVAARLLGAPTTRRRAHEALAALPTRRGPPASGYRKQALEAIRNLARACLSVAYGGYWVPLEFECAAGHRFSMLVHGLRLGHWCRACAYARATVYSIDDARAVAGERGGRCLSSRYRGVDRPMRWRCAA